MNNSGSEIPPSNQPPQDGLKVLPPKPMSGYVKQLVYLRRQDYIESVSIEPVEPGENGGGPGNKPEER